MSNQSEFIEIAALWDNESKSGKRYLSGKLGNARVFIFFETDKKNPKGPDARIFVAPNKERESGGNGQRGGQNNGQSRGGYQNSNGGYNRAPKPTQQQGSNFGGDIPF